MSLAHEARDIRRRIAERLRELEPLAREYEELMRIAADMGIEAGVGDEAAAGVGAEVAAGVRANLPVQMQEAERHPPEPELPSTVHSPLQPAGELAALVLQAVRSEPGRTVGDYALILGLTQTALYRPVRELTDDRMIVKRARQLFPA